VLLTIGIKLAKIFAKLVMIHLKQCQAKPQESVVWMIESAGWLVDADLREASRIAAQSSVVRMLDTAQESRVFEIGLY